MFLPTVLELLPPLPAQQISFAPSQQEVLLEREAPFLSTSCFSTHLLSAWWPHADVSPHRSTGRGTLTEQNSTSGLRVTKRKGDLAPSNAPKTTFNMKKSGGGVMDGESNPISEV